MKNLRIITKNSNPNIGYKNVDTTIRNFHTHNEFHNHKKIRINIQIKIGKNLYEKKKIEHHLLIDSPKKNHPLIKTPK